LRIDIKEVREVTSDILNEREYVAKILQCFQNPDDDELPKQLAKQPPRLHLLRQREKQSQKDKASPKRKPPQKPSRG
jgi:hypothetical protein